MLATALNARAQCSQAITVDIHRTNSAVETRCYNAGAAIDLTGLSNFSAIDLIQVYSSSTSSNAALGHITLAGTGSSGQDLKVLVRRASDGGFIERPEIPLFSAVSSWSGLDASGVTNAKVRFAGAISGDLTGSITVGAIVRLQVGGSIQAAVISNADEGASTGIQWVQAGSITAAGSITSTLGDIGTVNTVNQSVSPSLAGPISASGQISSIFAAGGINIAGAVGIRAGSAIRSVEAFNDVGPLDISAVIQATDQNGNIRHVRAKNLLGVVSAATLGSGEENPPAAIDVSETLAATVNTLAGTQGGAIRIGTRVAGNALQNMTGLIRSPITIGEGFGFGELPDADAVIGGELDFGANLVIQNASELGYIRFLGTLHSFVYVPEFSRIRELKFEAGILGGTIAGPGGLPNFRLDQLTVIGDASIDPFLRGSQVILSNGSGTIENATVTGNWWGFSEVGYIPGTFDVHGNLEFPNQGLIAGWSIESSLGEFPTDEPNAFIRVGGRFGYKSTSCLLCACDPILGCPTADNPDSTPGLHFGGFSNFGQIIFNAAAINARWDGRVSFGGLTGLVRLEPSASGDLRSPYYVVGNTDFGGGSIGLVPFHVHDIDCNPPRVATLPPTTVDPADGRTILNSAFTTPGSFAIEFYGPVWNSDLVPFEVFRADDQTGQIASETVSIGASLEFDTLATTNAAPFSRRVVFHGRPNFPKGLYAVTAKRQAPAGRGVLFSDPVVGPLCANLLTSENVPVADFTYYFRVLSDCNNSGVDDEIEIEEAYQAMQPIDRDFDGYIDSCEVGLGFCDPDVSADGNADQGDIDYLVNVVAGGPNTVGTDPDFNRDGNVDQADIDALINTLAGGACP